MKLPKWMVALRAKRSFTKKQLAAQSVLEERREWAERGWSNDLDKLSPGTLYHIVSPRDFCWVMPSANVVAFPPRPALLTNEVTITDFSIVMFVEKQNRYSVRYGYGIYYHILVEEKSYWIHRGLLGNHHFKEFDGFQNWS